MAGHSQSGEYVDQQWAELDQRFRAPLLAYFLRRVHDRAEAEDLTQEVFLRLSRHVDKSRGEGANAYVFMIAANLLTDRARARAARQNPSYLSLHEALKNYQGIASLVEDRTPEHVLVNQEALASVLAALAELGERTRDIFVLAHLENMQQRDIAALYGVTVSAVEKHVMKALAHLSARFMKE